MSSRFILRTLSLIGCVFVFGLAGQLCLAQNTASHQYKDAVKQSSKAATVFKEIMETSDRAIPKSVLDGAECVAVFPSVLKAGFIFGGRGGRGVASCRTKAGWSAPAFFSIKGGSVGLQIGAQSTDFILCFMNFKGLDKLIEDKFEIGGEGSVAAGPVGREAGASTNIRLDAEILSYSRSKGLFAGLELKGVVITQEKDDMEAVYGKGADARGILKDWKYTAPAEVDAFPNRLGRYASGKPRP